MGDYIDPPAPQGRKEPSLSAKAGRLMLKPAQLKEFQADFDIVSKYHESATKFLEYFRLCFGGSEPTANGMAQTTARAVLGMNKYRYHVYVCSQALYRMHRGETFVENYRDWEELCHALRIHPETSQALIGVGQALEAPIKKPLERDPSPELAEHLAILNTYLSGRRAIKNEGEMPAPATSKRRTQRSSRKMDLAKNLLTELLKDGAEVRITEIIEKAKTKRISETTLDRAKAAMKKEGKIDDKRIGGSDGYSVWFAKKPAATQTDGCEAESP